MTPDRMPSRQGGTVECGTHWWLFWWSVCSRGSRRGAVAQTAGDVFRQVAPSVVVIRAKGRDVAAGGQTRFNETGSGC